MQPSSAVLIQALLLLPVTPDLTVVKECRVPR